MTQPWQLYLLWGVVDRLGHGRARGAARGDHLDTLVLDPARPRERAADGLERERPARLPAAARVDLDHLRLALDGRRGRRSRRSCIVIPLAIVFLRHSPAEIGVDALRRDRAGAAGAAASRTRSATPSRRCASSRRGATSSCSCSRSSSAARPRTASSGRTSSPPAPTTASPQVQGAGLLAAIGVFDIIGTITSGWLTDRYDPRWLLFWYYGLRGISLLGLNAALNSAGVGLAAFVIFDGLDWVATVPPTIALCRKMAGPERVGVVFAWVFCSHQLGAAFAAWGAGFTRSWLGTYEPAFLIAGALGVAAAMVEPHGRPAHRAAALRLRRLAQLAARAPRRRAPATTRCARSRTRRRSRAPSRSPPRRRGSRPGSPRRAAPRPPG